MFNSPFIAKWFQKQDYFVFTWTAAPKNQVNVAAPDWWREYATDVSGVIKPRAVQYGKRMRKWWLL